MCYVRLQGKRYAIAVVACGVMPEVGVSRKSAIAVMRHTRNFGVANANIGQERRCRRHCQPLAKRTRPSYSDWAVQT